mgnify:CR=1 FL=1
MVDKTKETDEVKRARIQQMADEATKEISKKEKKEKKGKGPAGSRAKETYLNPDFKEGDSTDFGMLSVEAGIDNNPKPTQADRIAGATKNEKKTVKAKSGSRTGVRGTGAAKRGFRKARLS